MAGVEGYFWETPDQVWQFAQEKQGHRRQRPLRGETVHGGLCEKGALCNDAFLAALETLSGDFALAPRHNRSGPDRGDPPGNDRAEICAGNRRVYCRWLSTVNFKVGFDVEQDIGRVPVDQESPPGKGAALRADANQGFTLRAGRPVREGRGHRESPIPRTTLRGEAVDGHGGTGEDFCRSRWGWMNPSMTWNRSTRPVN